MTEELGLPLMMDGEGVVVEGATATGSLQADLAKLRALQTSGLPHQRNVGPPAPCSPFLCCKGTPCSCTLGCTLASPHHQIAVLLAAVEGAIAENAAAAETQQGADEAIAYFGCLMSLFQHKNDPEHADTLMSAAYILAIVFPHLKGREHAC
jgi:hypothetical protein